MIHYNEIDQEITKTILKEHEGYKLESYFCSEGFKTGGFGHRILEGEDIPTTKEGWEEVFQKDFDKAVDGASELITVDTLSPAAFGIVVEMCYQMGQYGVSKFKMFLSELNKEEPLYEEASLHMLDSKWAKEQTPRRAKEMAHRMSMIGTFVG